MASSDRNVSSSIELGEIDRDATDREIQTSTSKRKPYAKYSADERFKIGKYTSENGPIATVRKFEKQFPNMNESTARTFKKKYESELDDDEQQRRAKPTSIPLKPQGRPLLFGELDGLVQQYILAASNRGNVISRNIAVSAAKVIMERYPRLIGSVDIESSHWAQSLFRRMGFRRRQATTSKLEIPEVKMLFHHDIVTKVAKFNIPDSLIINLAHNISEEELQNCYYQRFHRQTDYNRHICHISSRRLLANATNLWWKDQEMLATLQISRKIQFEL